MITVFADQDSPRLDYVLHYLFKHILNTDYQLITNEAKLLNKTGVIISYSTKKLSPFHIQPSYLLFETETRRLVLECDRDEVIPRLLFPVNKNGLTPFDPFAAIFFLISRYEEYVHPKTDHHGRLLPEFTWVVQNGLLKFPIVDVWVNELISQINNTFGTSYEQPKFSSISTIDLDNGYKYYGKGFKRTSAALLKDLKDLNLKIFTKRLRTVTGLSRDEYDIYNWLINYHREKNLPLIFFVLNARRGSHDRGLPRNSKALRNLVQKFISENVPYGIHPSYHSNRKKITLRHEIEGLRDMGDKPVLLSRQHYLRFRMPTTFENLIELGIEHDFSLGFASQYGFRAGTSRSFYFYNLVSNNTTNLLMHPCTIMEGTFKDYMKISPTEALQHIQEMVAIVKEVGGEFISIWHEAQLTEQSPWKKTYLEMNEMILAD